MSCKQYLKVPYYIKELGQISYFFFLFQLLLSQIFFEISVVWDEHLSDIKS